MVLQIIEYIFKTLRKSYAGTKFFLGDFCHYEMNSIKEN